MDPLFFSSPPNGVPSESKLATYMSRQTITPTYGLTSGLTNLSLDSPISIKKTQVTPQSPEFIPSRLTSSTSPNFYTPYASTIGGTTTTPVKPNLNQSIIGTNGIYNATPIKAVGRSLMRNDSPQSTNESPRLTPQPSPPPVTTVSAAVLQENVNGTTYFYPTATHTSSQTSSTGSENAYGNGIHTNTSYTQQQPVHVYSGPASHVMDMQPTVNLSPAFFMPEEMRNEILERNQISNLLANENQDLPYEVDNYHSFYALEMTHHHMKLPVNSSSYRATHAATGIKYCLRRLHGYRIQSKCLPVVELWKKLRHSNIVKLTEVFTTKAFGDHSLILVYDFHPGSETVYSKYFTPKLESNGYTDPFPGEARPFSHKSSVQRSSSGPILPEPEIWSIIMQLTAGLRAIHQASLACRSLDPSKIIITGKRIRFSFLGISDIVSYDPTQANNLAAIQHYQQEDLTKLGHLVLALSCRSLQAIHRDHVQTSIELVTRNYSQDLRNLILYLLNTTNRRSVCDLMPMIGARFYTQLDALQSQCDMQEDELAKEMENGRLYRILVKLGTINERPELNMDVTWSETGDRYMLKLYRDYLFHSVTEDGRPWLDHAHIVQSLNRLDAGTLDKVQLMSRDEQSIIVVTYAELKECFDKAFSEIVSYTV